MKVKQYNYTKFVSDDGSEWDTENKAITRDALVKRVNEIMRPLGNIHPKVENHDGWVHHDLEVVNTVKDRLLDLIRESKLNEEYPVLNTPGRDCNPLSIVGRIIDDFGGPVNEAWRRICCIDVQGREHQQPYFAYTGGPDPGHYCVEDRRK